MSTTTPQPALSPDATMLERILALHERNEPIPSLNVDEIDACIEEVESSERILTAAKKINDSHKAALIVLVRANGSVPDGAPQSKRILGRRNIATVTIGTSTTVNEDAVGDLKAYLGDDSIGAWLFPKLFAAETKHKLVDGARNVLAGIGLPKRTHEKVLSLFGRCFDINAKSPVLKISVIKPEKPARQPRSKKVAA